MVVCFVKICLQTCSSIGDYFEGLTVKHPVCSDLLVAGSAWRVWLWLQTKPKQTCFQLSCCADEKEPGFPLVGGETDTWLIEPSLFMSASSLEAWWAHICQQTHVRGELPICQVFYQGMHMFISLIMAKIPKHRHKGKHRRTHNWMSKNPIILRLLKPQIIGLSIVSEPIYFLMMLRNQLFT